MRMTTGWGFDAWLVWYRNVRQFEHNAVIGQLSNPLHLFQLQNIRLLGGNNHYSFTYIFLSYSRNSRTLCWPRPDFV